MSCTSETAVETSRPAIPASLFSQTYGPPPCRQGCYTSPGILVADQNRPGPPVDTVQSSLKNPDSRGWVVQKFGGTSIGKYPEKIAEDVIRASLDRNKIAVVCSAKRVGEKATGTTSRLLQVYKKLQNIAAAVGAPVVQDELVNQAKVLVREICNSHIFAAEAVLRNPDLKKALCHAIQNECQELIEYIIAIRRFNLEVNSRAKRRVVGFGDKLSCRFMTYVLKDKHVKAAYVDLTDAIHLDSNGGHEDDGSYQDAISTLRKRLLDCGEHVPVIAGFSSDSLIDGFLKPGYTDLCAALVAIGLKAEELQIWKEVDGFFTADPTKVPTARLLSSITPLEAAELTYWGSEVVNNIAVEQVMKVVPPIPVRIRNIKSPQGEGTVIRQDPAFERHHPLRQTRGPNLPDSLQLPLPKRPTAVTIRDNISIINLHSKKCLISYRYNFLTTVFSILNKSQISVDLISASEMHISLAIHLRACSAANFNAARQQLEDCSDVSVMHNMAILSLVGADLKNMIGIAGRMFSILGEHNINIEMISQGASEITISCVVDAREAARAMSILHTCLFTFLG